MKGKVMSNPQNVFIPLVLGVIAAVIVYAHLSGKALPLISSPRSTMVALFIVGFSMCAFGIMQVAASGRWASPLAIVGYLLGAIILVIFISAITGGNLPMVHNDDRAIVAIAIMMVVKFLIGMTSPFLHLL